MVSLTMIVWMSVTSAILYGIWPEWSIRDTTHTLVQVSCFLAASVQAGFLETGVDSKFRKPLQLVAVFFYIVFVAMCHPGFKVAVDYLVRL